MKAYTYSEHFAELKSRLIKIVCFALAAFAISYYKSQDIYLFLSAPLTNILSPGDHRIIYTGLTEAFFTYLKIAAFASFIVTIPFIAYQLYKFIAPGLYKDERKIAVCILAMAPILFWTGGIFVFYLVIPKAWHFFLSFEVKDSALPLVLEARISEYLGLVTQLIVAFGLAFELPIIFASLTLMGIVSGTFLQRKRRLAIIINFIIAGLITPPDVLSQIALALPMLLLYEISIGLCKYLENRKHVPRVKSEGEANLIGKKNVRHQVDSQ